MLVPVRWLKDYVNIDVDIKEFCDRMIMSGSNLETAEHFGENIENVVVGKIEKIEKHPHADKLVVCKINIGASDLLQIVTGASNVFEGAIVPVAVDGALVPGPLHGKPKEEGGTRIHAGQLRGIDSFGMLCSAEELGFADKVSPLASREGIWILDPNAGFELGKCIVEAMELDDYVVDFEITPNRPDCLAMLGMAMETSATFQVPMVRPEIKCECKGEKTAGDFISVEIRKPELCKRYTARIITDVKIGQSPWWLQERLMYAGMRPINNIVDITNFVMLEYGQPLHAFDIETVAEKKIVVDTAVNGQRFITLDNKERELTDTMLMINDGKGPIAIAGVMGGMNSEISSTTNTVILESANFLGDSVRLTAKKLGFRTEASGRYEKGIDPNLCEEAADRFCKLVEMLGAGKVVPGSVDVYPNMEKPQTYSNRVSRINKVLGTELTRETMEGYLKRLGIEVGGEGDILLATPPTVRQDLKIEEDFVEEVARIHGYNNLPTTIPRSNVMVETSKSWQIRELAREFMCGMGVNEIQTYSFVSPKGVTGIGIDEDAWENDFVKLLNPLGEDTSVMRTILMPNMIEVMGRNAARNVTEVKAYEIGNTFTPNMIKPEGLPDEQLSMSVGLYGEGIDFFTLKGIVCEMLTSLGIGNLSFEAEPEYGVYHPGRCARVLVGDNELGIMGEIHPNISEKYGLPKRSYACELMFDKIINMAYVEKYYKPLPKYPSSSRDIALLVGEDILVGNLESIIKEAGKELLEGVELFDVYRGKQVQEGKKSVAFALTYRASDRTLTDEDVNKIHSKVLDALKQKTDAVLRDI